MGMMRRREMRNSRGIEPPFIDDLAGLQVKQVVCSRRAFTSKNELGLDEGLLVSENEGRYELPRHSALA